MSGENQSIDSNFITIDSTKEEVSNFFSSHYNISQEISNNLIKENISGEILLYLQDSDFKYLGIKPGIKKKNTSLPRTE